MADYWKSQPRHFCDFCKCWTADNKPSREFHEKGKRHQESVKKKLDDLRKKSVEDAKSKKETSNYIVQMEKAAMKKLKEDLKADPSLASQYGVTFKSTTEAQVKVEAVAHVKVEDAGGEWIEGYSPEGYVYYWNTLTQESRWDVPTMESTVASTSNTQSTNHMASAVASASSISRTDNKKSDSVTDQPTPAAVQIKSEQEDDTNVRVELQLKRKEANRLKAEKKKLEKKEAAAAAVRKESTMLVVPKVEPGAVDKPRFRSAYGAWTTVSTEEEKLVDYELPTDSDYIEGTEEVIEPKVEYSAAAAAAAAVSNEPKLKFTERTMTCSLGEGKSEGFKKRKFNSGAQRNIRGEKKFKNNDDHDDEDG